LFYEETEHYVNRRHLSTSTLSRTATAVVNLGGDHKSPTKDAGESDKSEYLQPSLIGLRHFAG
jgi:hypothetical protein